MLKWDFYKTANMYEQLYKHENTWCMQIYKQIMWSTYSPLKMHISSTKKKEQTNKNSPFHPATLGGSMTFLTSSLVYNILSVWLGHFQNCPHDIDFNITHCVTSPRKQSPLSGQISKEYQFEGSL